MSTAITSAPFERFIFSLLSMRRDSYGGHAKLAATVLLSLERRTRAADTLAGNM